MHADEERMIFLQHLAELRRDALGQKDRHARSDAEKFDMGDAAETLEDFLELRVREEQGIASGKENVAHFVVFFEVAEGGFEVRLQLLLTDPADDAAAGAVAAIRGAAVRDEKKNAVRIAVHQSRHWHV